MPQDDPEVAGVKSSLRRRFTLSDALVLIGATAVGLGWTRAAFDGDWFELKAQGVVEPSFIVQALWKWSDLAIPCLTAWTVALALLWLRRPRETVRRLSRRPGAVACAAVVASLVVNVAFYLLFYALVSSLPGSDAGWFFRLPGLLRCIADDSGGPARPRGEAIAVCWSILWLSGRWRAQATWLDRLGRAIAVIWLIASVPFFFFPIDEPGHALM